MKQQEETNLILQRSRSASASASTRNNRRIISSNDPFRASESDDFSDKLLLRRGSSPFSFQQQEGKQTTPRNKLSSLIRSFLNMFTFQTITPSCKWLTIFPSAPLISVSTAPSSSLGRKITGTLFGHRRGNISFAVQL